MLNMEWIIQAFCPGPAIQSGWVAHMTHSEICINLSTHYCTLWSQSSLRGSVATSFPFRRNNWCNTCSANLGCSQIVAAVKGKRFPALLFPTDPIVQKLNTAWWLNETIVHPRICSHSDKTRVIIKENFSFTYLNYTNKKLLHLLFSCNMVQFN